MTHTSTTINNEILNFHFPYADRVLGCNCNCYIKCLLFNDFAARYLHVTQLSHEWILIWRPLIIIRVSLQWLGQCLIRSRFVCFFCTWFPWLDSHRFWCVHIRCWMNSLMLLWLKSRQGSSTGSICSANCQKLH